MAHLRLAIATPRFWPLIDDRSTHLLRLAEALIAAGHAVTVVTPRWQRTWPERMSIGPLPLVRLRGSAAGGFSTLRWMYALGAWLGEQRHNAVLLAGLKHEAYVALGAEHKSRVPTILLAGDDDLEWEQTATLGNRIATRCRTAKAIVAPTQALADSLNSAGYPLETISVIERGAASQPSPAPERQIAARAALAAANYDLATASNAIVALAVGRLDAACRFGDLVRAWRIVTARRPEARLWIIGDGPERERLFRQISDLDQRFRAMLPGTFECVNDLLEASDMLIVPAETTVPPLVMLDAQAAGLPVIAADGHAAQQCIKHGETGLLYSPGEFKSLAASVLSLMEDRAAAVQLAAAARAASANHQSPMTEAVQYVSLIERLRSVT